MGVKVATTSLQWLQPILSHPPSTSQALPCAISSSKPFNTKDRDLMWRLIPHRSAFGGTAALMRSKSCELWKSKTTTLRRSCSANWEGFSDENREDCFNTAINDSSIERKANSLDLPLSLRIIKRKIQWEERLFTEAKECSVTKAFSSMVFMIRELQSFTLGMRKLLLYEDLQGIVCRVHKEMHASFVWLFQQVFSHTPTLMVYVMILLANFTVYSMGTNAAIAQVSPIHKTEIHDQKMDSLSIKVSGRGGKTSCVGGNNGGGGKVLSVGSGMEGDGLSNGWNHLRRAIPNESSSFESKEELVVWKSIVEEAESEKIDDTRMLSFVSPVRVKIEEDDYMDYLKTEVAYQRGLANEPNNSLLLANYAQFLAEEYFKRAIGVEDGDAEGSSKYASFLWRVKGDLWGAEESFLKAIDADPTNAYYAANYAHFLWNTGGEDTCFPLQQP